jgi:hypothetical protein
MKIEEVKIALPDQKSWEGEINLIHESARAEEAALMQTRWFDYHDLTPGQATLLFARTFNEVAQRYWEKTQSVTTDMKSVPVNEAGLMVTQCDIAVWRARQEADRLGCRYETMITFAFERFLNRGFSFMPRPNQIYSEEILLDLADMIKDLRSQIFEYSKDEFYKTENFRGNPDQIRHRKYLLDYVKSRAVMNQSGVLSRLISEGLLTQEIAEEHFPTEVTSRIFDFW